jgi:hypothetical protein
MVDEVCENENFNFFKKEKRKIKNSEKKNLWKELLENNSSFNEEEDIDDSSFIKSKRKRKAIDIEDYVE